MEKEEAQGTDLGGRHCVPCRVGQPPLEASAVDELAARLPAGWRVVEGHHLEKSFSFPDFRRALDFTVRVGAVAEREGHHPDVHLSWGRVTLEIWTHKIDGLTESDFILAAKVDGL